MKAHERDRELVGQNCATYLMRAQKLYVDLSTRRERERARGPLTRKRLAAAEKLAREVFNALVDPDALFDELRHDAAPEFSGHEQRSRSRRNATRL